MGGTALTKRWPESKHTQKCSKYSSVYSTCALMAIHHLCKTNKRKKRLDLFSFLPEKRSQYFRSMWKKLNFCMKQYAARERHVISWLLNVLGISPSQACGALSKKSLDGCRTDIMAGRANTVGRGQIPGARPANISAFQPVKHSLMTDDFIF